MRLKGIISSFWQLALICVLVAILLLKPAVGVYASEQLLELDEFNMHQQEDEDFLKFKCEKELIALIAGTNAKLICILTNTTAGTVGHNVLLSVVENTGKLQPLVNPGKISETPYNVENEVSIEIKAPPDTPAGTYTVEVSAQGSDTNLAKQAITVEVSVPTPTITATHTPTETSTLTPSPSATLTNTSIPTITLTHTASPTITPEVVPVTEPVSLIKGLLTLPWWLWVLIGISLLSVLGFVFWVLFFRKGARIPCWLWVIFFVAGLMISSILCYILFMLLM
jgi:hypothetical protein